MASELFAQAHEIVKGLGGHGLRDCPSCGFGRPGVNDAAAEGGWRCLFCEALEQAYGGELLGRENAEDDARTAREERDEMARTLARETVRRGEIEAGRRAMLDELDAAAAMMAKARAFAGTWKALAKHLRAEVRELEGRAVQALARLGDIGTDREGRAVPLVEACLIARGCHDFEKGRAEEGARLLDEVNAWAGEACDALSAPGEGRVRSHLPHLARAMCARAGAAELALEAERAAHARTQGWLDRFQGECAAAVVPTLRAEGKAKRYLAALCAKGITPAYAAEIRACNACQSAEPGICSRHHPTDRKATLIAFTDPEEERAAKVAAAGEEVRARHAGAFAALAPNDGGRAPALAPGAAERLWAALTAIADDPEPHPRRARKLAQEALAAEMRASTEATLGPLEAAAEKAEADARALLDEPIGFEACWALAPGAEDDADNAYRCRCPKGHTDYEHVSTSGTRWPVLTGRTPSGEGGAP